MTDSPTIPQRTTFATDGLSPRARDIAGQRLRNMRRRLTSDTPEGGAGLLSPHYDSLLFLLAICAMLLPTTAGFGLASAAASTAAGTPLAILMFASPFLVISMLPLRILYLTLDGLFGIRLRKRVLLPLAALSLGTALAFGPLHLRPALPNYVPTAAADPLVLPS